MTRRTTRQDTIQKMRQDDETNNIQGWNLLRITLLACWLAFYFISLSLTTLLTYEGQQDDMIRLGVGT
jgi:hypothetical protein